jgi:HK97 family phage prohead protease
LRDVEWRESQDDPNQDYTFVGTAAVFNIWSELLWTPRGAFRERFLPGSFVDILASPKLDTRFLKNHDKNLVLARTKSGTLELEENDDALRAWARVAKTTYATDLKLSMERGDIDQMSIQFELDYDNGAESRWYEDKRSGEVRHDVVRVSDLFDVSVVTFPAYAETTAAMRDLDRAQSRGMISVPRGVSSSHEYSPRAYARCRQVVAETAWAMHPPFLSLIMGILEERSSGNKPSAEEIRERVGVKRDNDVTMVGSVAVIPVLGPIMSRAGAMNQISGAKSLDDFKAEFRQAVNDPEVTHIVLDIDSPGGTVDGVPEMAAEIRKARDVKPIYGVANYMAASAAFWLLCACTETYASPSAEVGSVGVYTAHNDRSAEMEMKGQNVTFVYAGEHKVELNPFESLSEDAKARLQEEVDSIYDDFVASVAKNRGTTKKDVLDNYGQGRMKMSQEALAAGMIDGVATLDEVVAGINKGKPAAKQLVAGASASEQDASTEAEILPSPLDAGAMSRDQIREVLGLPFGAQAETDPVVNNRNGAQAETDPVVGAEEHGAQAETDPVVGADSPAAHLKAKSAAEMQRAREERVRLTKEMLK